MNEYEDYIDHVAEKILDILATYFWRSDDDTGAKTFHWQGRKMFKEHVVHWVRKNESVKLTLPAFPFKSVSITLSLDASDRVLTSGSQIRTR